MVHLVKVDCEVFGVSGGLVGKLLREYANGETVDYDTIFRKLKNNKSIGGDNPQINVFLGYLDFDAMKDEGPREPVRIGGYAFPI